MKKKSRINYFKTSREGGVSVALMLIVISISVLVGGYMKFSLNNLFLARRSIDLERARIFAESALDAAEAQVKLSIEGYDLGVSAHLLGTLISPSFPQSQYNAEILKAEFAPNTSSGFVQTNMNGLVKHYVDVIITAGVSNKVTGVTASFQETVRIIKERFVRNAIFYDGLLELHPGVNMTVNGDMVSNDAIKLWIGHSGKEHKLKFRGKIRAKDGITVFKNGTGWTLESIAKRVLVKVAGVGYESFLQDGSVLDSNNPAWDTQSMIAWGGRVLTGDRAGTVNLPIEKTVDNHVLIEPPKSTDSDRVKKTKLANKADLYIKVRADGKILIKNSAGGFDLAGIDAEAKLSGVKDSHGVYKINPNASGKTGWIDVQTDFYDPRESEASYTNIVNGTGSIEKKKMQMVNIYMDQLLKTYPGKKMVYVEVEDPSSGSAKPAVRLRNGYNLKPNNGNLGLSIASARTGYVEGDFNIKSKLPVLIAMDNLTVLSSLWDDSKSKDEKPTGADTALNACVMIGYADPDHLLGKEKTGGAHNLVRFRENLSGKDYSFMGSYISLWAAKDSHALYSTKFYVPPTRVIKFDPIFKTRQPPFMPNGYSTPLVMKWAEINWDKARTATN